MTEAEQRLIDVAILMAQELQEYVDVAIECSGNNSAELATQGLLNDWEEAYRAAGITEEQCFVLEKAAACWRYPPNMPAPGQRVLHTYETETADGKKGESSVILGTPIHADGSHMINGEPIYKPVVRWAPVPETSNAVE